MRVATSTAQSTLYFLSSDHLGSSSLTTDASGNFVARQLYDAWGNVRSGGGLPTDIGYTGQRLDSGTNLLFMHARYYDSQIGRWSSPDSIIPDESNPQSLNRYSYVNNEPLNHTDPTGHITTGACGGDEGCQSDQGSEIYYYAKYMNDHHEPGMAALVLYYYATAKSILATYRPEMDSPPTAAENPFAQAIRGTENDLKDHPGWSPEEIWQTKQDLGLEFANGIIGTAAAMSMGRSFGSMGYASGSGLTEGPLGGMYNDVKGNRPIGDYQFHHTPPQSISPYGEAGPGFFMETNDHRLTASWGYSLDAQAYRATQAALIQAGKFDDAVMMDIEDAISKFGDKYIQAILDMIDGLP